jgi:asparagine synthase (glutamine-hydrolysing)
MCGINVIVGTGDSITMDNLRNMQSSLEHRGPDSSGQFQHQWGNTRLMLASNRLWVVDENPLSDQPFQTADGRYCLVYNGEIYNHHDLKNELISSGDTFTTASDTEVLLHWLIRYGKDGISRLNGMFAFVFIDVLEQKLLVARDKHGIKPLFYHESKELLIISSEIQGVLASGLVEKKLNATVIPHYLSYKYAPRPATFYKGILELEPGAIRTYHKCTLRTRLEIADVPVSDDTALGAVLTDVLARQIAGVATPGLMLSGGVDSTLLLALLNKELGLRGVSTYTMSYLLSGKPLANDDTIFARKAAKLYAANHHEVAADVEVLSRFPEFMSVMDQPVADSGAFATWLVAEQAGTEHKVLLSGAGADELFAGYNRHRAFYFYLRHYRKWWFGFLNLAGKIPQQRNSLNHLQKLAGAIDAVPAVTYRNFLTFDTFADLADIAPIWIDKAGVDYNLNKALLHDKTQYLPADVLAITDRAGMKASVEIRVPYLDDRVVNYAARFSGPDLLRNGKKWMLTDLLNSYGGKLFTKRKKTGFGLPTNHWFNDKSTDWLWSFMEKDTYLFDFVRKPVISGLLADHRRGVRNNSLELWSVLILQQWLEKEFGHAN